MKEQCVKYWKNSAKYRKRIESKVTESGIVQAEKMAIICRKSNFRKC